MSQTTDSTQTEIQSTVDSEDTELVNLDDKNDTTLQTGDILVDARTDEKLIILSYDGTTGCVKYYSNYEREEGLHDIRFIPACFDWVCRSKEDDIKTISLTPA